MVIDDITPDHDPSSLMKDTVKRVEEGDIRSMVVVLVDGEGRIWRRTCGHHRMEVLWALECSIHELMNGDD